MNDVNRLHTLIGPYPDDKMEAYPVSKRVNSPANDDVELSARVAIE